MTDTQLLAFYMGGGVTASDGHGHHVALVHRFSPHDKLTVDERAVQRLVDAGKVQLVGGRASLRVKRGRGYKDPIPLPARRSGE